MNKTCINHKAVLELFKTHHKGILFAKGGVRHCHIFLMLWYDIYSYKKLYSVILIFKYIIFQFVVLYSVI